MNKDLIPITPATHYTMGGLKCDKDSKTSLNNLYVIGEASSNGVHGANRLGGNSLLEIVLFGKKLGENFDKINNSPFLDKTIYNQNISDFETLFTNTPKSNFYEIRKELGEMMFKNVGLFRTKEGLYEALSFVENIINNFSQFGITDKSKVYNTNLVDFLEFKNIVVCAKTIILCALNRCESRGSHYRNDFPNSLENYKNSTIINNNFEIK